jgi:phosphatidylglycerophosphatase A
MRSLILFVATGAGTGYAPVAPGTAGSVPGLILTWLVFTPMWRYSMPLFLIVYLAAFAASCWIAGRAEEIFERRDDSRIVIDEVLGMTAAMFLLPADWQHLALGFFLFRLFDTLKPFPAGAIDRRMPGGTGVMLDDLAAAIYANLVGQVLARFI